MTLEFERRLTRDWDDPSVIGVDGYVAKGGYEGLKDALGMPDAAALPAPAKALICLRS